jgi:hypothetical protein
MPDSHFTPLLCSKLSRRRMMKLSGSALLLAGVWPGALDAAEAKGGGFHFVVLNDLHVVDEKCAAFLAEKVVASIKGLAEKPGRCLIAGDLSEDGTAGQIGAVREAFKALRVPVRVVPGNHDYAAMNDRKAYDQLCPGASNYAFEHGGWQFVGIDSTEGTKAVAATSKGTLDWLDANLARLDRRRPMVLFTHFPLGPRTPNRATNADAVLERFKPYNLRGVLGGHHHGLTEREVGVVSLVTNRCCSLKKGNHDRSREKGYFVVRATPEGVLTRRFVEVRV